MTIGHDEQDWGLTIDRCDDGDILLRQGDACGCGDDVVVRLHPAFHFPLIAEYMGLMTQDQFESANAKSTDRLHVMAGLINASLPPEHPLVIAAAVLLGTSPKRATQRAGTPAADNGQLELIGE
jgi:hypothetical protein